MTAFWVGDTFNNFWAGVVAFFAIPFFIGMAFEGVKQAFVAKASKAEAERARLDRSWMDLNDAVRARKTLLQFGALTPELNDAIEAEIAVSVFSETPYSARKIDQRLANVTEEDADDALEMLQGAKMLTAAQAQEIRDAIDLRAETGVISAA